MIFPFLDTGVICLILLLLTLTEESVHDLREFIKCVKLVKVDFSVFTEKER